MPAATRNSRRRKASSPADGAQDSAKKARITTSPATSPLHPGLPGDVMAIILTFAGCKAAASLETTSRFSFLGPVSTALGSTLSDDLNNFSRRKLPYSNLVLCCLRFKDDCAQWRADYVRATLELSRAWEAYRVGGEGEFRETYYTLALQQLRKVFVETPFHKSHLRCPPEVLDTMRTTYLACDEDGLNAHYNLLHFAAATVSSLLHFAHAARVVFIVIFS